MVVGTLKYYRIPVGSIMQLDGIRGVLMVSMDLEVYSKEPITHFRLFTTKTLKAIGLEEYDFPTGKWKPVSVSQ